MPRTARPGDLSLISFICWPKWTGRSAFLFSLFWKFSMVEMFCSVGDRIRIGNQGLVEIVAVQGQIIQVRVTHQPTDPQTKDLKPVHDGYDDLRHSE